MALMEKLPASVYHGERHVGDLQQALAPQLEQAGQARAELFRQLRPATATWGLERYEREYGLPPDEERDPARRLARWRAKRRGRGTTTKGLILEMGESYLHGRVSVVEYPGEYRMEIRVPHQLDLTYIEDFIGAVEEVKPAHLGLGIGYTDSWAEVLGLRVWQDCREKTWAELLGLCRWQQHAAGTWGDLAVKTWGQLLGSGTWGPLLGDRNWQEIKTENPDWNSVYHYRGVKCV